MEEAKARGEDPYAAADAFDAAAEASRVAPKRKGMFGAFRKKWQAVKDVFALPEYVVCVKAGACGWMGGVWLMTRLRAQLARCRPEPLSDSSEDEEELERQRRLKEERDLFRRRR